LSDGSAILDPCEAEPVDIGGYLTTQQREELIAAGQVACLLHSRRLKLYHSYDKT